MSLAELRPYQKQAIDEVRAAIRAGKRKIMICAATGSGKTLTAASILAGALAKGNPSVFIAHRVELLDQTLATFARLGITTTGIIRAKDKRTDATQPIQIASIQTLVGRDAPPASIVIVDEAHRAAAASYGKVLTLYPNAVILGLSATPCRTDGKPLGLVFDHLVIASKYSALISDGHLAEPIVYSTPMLPDLSSVRTARGDYNAEDLEAAVNKGTLIGDLVTQHARLSGGRRTVLFAVSVKHSIAVVAAFRMAGVRAEHLDGTTPELERAAILARLADGSTELVSNVGVLCEGWDCPPVKCVVLARPTKSLVIFMQTAGRVLRPWNDVQPIILDHGGNVDRFGLPHEDREWSLSSKVKKAGTAPAKNCPECFAYVAASCGTCPHCGHLFTADGAPVPEYVEPIPVDLAVRSLAGDDAQLSFFRATRAKARERGYRYAYVAHRFAERWGKAPPSGWFKALREDWKRDDEWKARVSKRQADAAAKGSAAIDVATGARQVLAELERISGDGE